MAISGAGFGTEQTSIPEGPSKYRGFAFWEHDPFQTKNLGVSDPKPKVIICGGGDGALQDFLRIIARKTAGEMYKLLGLPGDAIQMIEEQIFRAEDRALRSFVWSSSGVLDHPIHKKLHFDHQSAVDSLFAHTKAWKSVTNSLKGLIGNLSKRLNIQLAFPCEHFSNCYSLNRFMVLLVNKYLSAEFGIDVLLPGVRVIAVDGVSHQCLGNPYLCHGQLHELKYANATCQNFEQVGANPPQLKTITTGPFHVVIVRNGIKPSAPPLGQAAVALPKRQIVPHEYPW